MILILLKEYFFCFKNIIKEANTINKVIGVDSTFNVSKEKYPLLVFTCVNKFYITKVLAICFMLGEKIENYIFAFEAYLKVGFSIPESIFCDQNAAQVSAIETIFPTTHIKYCIFIVTLLQILVIISVRAN